MQCPACRHELPDKFSETCPQCGAPVVCEQISTPDTQSDNGIDPRLKELIEDVRKSLEELPGEANICNQFVPASDLKTEHVQGLSEENLGQVIEALDRASSPETATKRTRKISISVMAVAGAIGAVLLLVAFFYMRPYLTTQPPSSLAPVKRYSAIPGTTQIPAPPDIAKQEPDTPQKMTVVDNHTASSVPETSEHEQTISNTTSSVQETSPLPQPDEKTFRHFYTIHTDSYRSLHKAEREAERLRGMGYDASVRQFDSPENGCWYRVVIGQFANRQEALDALHHVQRTLHKNDARIVCVVQ